MTANGAGTTRREGFEPTVLTGLSHDLHSPAGTRQQSICGEWKANGNKAA